MQGGYTADCGTKVVDPANTILDGGGLDTVLALASEDKTIFLVEGLTLRNGSTTTASHGGGLYAKTKGDVSLTNNTFSTNTAEILRWRGSTSITGSYSDVTLSDNTF